MKNNQDINKLLELILHTKDYILTELEFAVNDDKTYSYMIRIINTEFNHLTKELKESSN